MDKIGKWIFDFYYEKYVCLFFFFGMLRINKIYICLFYLLSQKVNLLTKHGFDLVDLVGLV
jgi:hypothetical protein